MRLDPDDLFRTPVPALERLAHFLGLDVRPRVDESERAYKARLAYAIARWEKCYQQGRE